MRPWFLGFFFVACSALVAGDLRMAITVDDLPAHGALPRGETRTSVTRAMLDAFRAHGVVEAYGFINAKKVDDDPTLEASVDLWVERGYPLGNHAFSHKSLHDVSIEEFKVEIDQNEPMLQAYGGDWKFFRYPYLREGDTLEKREAIRAHLAQKGYTLAQVTVDFEDWSWNAPFARCKDQKNRKGIRWLEKTYLQNAVDQLDRAEILSKALFGRSIPHVLLLHVGAFDARMMPKLLRAYEKRGVRFIPLREAMADEVYTFDPKFVGKYGSEFTYQVLKARGLTLQNVGLKPYDGFPKERLTSICTKR